MVDEHGLPPIPFLGRTHGEVYPIVTLTIALDEEFVKILLAVIGRIEQDGRIADSLLHASTADIYTRRSKISQWKRKNRGSLSQNDRIRRRSKFSHS